MTPFEITVNLNGKDETFLVTPVIEEKEYHEYWVFDGEVFLGKV